MAAGAREPWEKDGTEKCGQREPRNLTPGWPAREQIIPEVRGVILTRRWVLSRPAMVDAMISKNELKFSPRLPDSSRSGIETPACAINVLFPRTHELKMAL
jgi:hypothetical protein